MRLIVAVMLCAGVAQADNRGLKLVDEASGPLTLTLRAAALVSGVRRAVAPGDTLRTGDRLEAAVEVDRAAWVYVAQVFADGTSALLYPPADDLRVQPGAAVRLPPPGQWFELDAHPGDEHVVVIASERPIDEADEEAKRVLDELRHPVAAAPAVPAGRKRAARPSHSTAPRPAAPRPTALSLRTRGLFVVGEGEDRPLTARTDGRGVAIFRFSFKHAPK